RPLQIQPLEMLPDTGLARGLEQRRADRHLQADQFLLVRQRIGHLHADHPVAHCGTPEPAGTSLSTGGAAGASSTTGSAGTASPAGTSACQSEKANTSNSASGENTRTMARQII